MDPLESFRATAQELVAHAQQQGIDLGQFRKDFTFLKDRRWIDVWRKDSLPGTGLPMNRWEHCIITCRGPSPCCQVA